MGIFEHIDTIMGFMFLIFIVMFVFVLLFMISPKLRGKFMAKQFKSMKHMIDLSKDDITDITSTMGNISVASTKRIIDNNESDLRSISSKTANINKDAVEITTRAIKNGLTQEEKVYCKHCGERIDSDSTFCKKCGKKQ